MPTPKLRFCRGALCSVAYIGKPAAVEQHIVCRTHPKTSVLATSTVVSRLPSIVPHFSTWRLAFSIRSTKAGDLPHVLHTILMALEKREPDLKSRINVQSLPHRFQSMSFVRTQYDVFTH